MLDRVLIAAFLILAGIGAFWVFRQQHLHRATAALAGRSTPITNRPPGAGAEPPASGLPAGKPALLYFRSDACVPCVAQARFIQQLQAEYGDGLLVEKVDADKDQAAAERYGVFTLPTTLVVDRTGRVRHANYGLTDARRLASQLASLN